VLSIYGAIGSDARMGPENLGSFWENEPILEGILRALKGASLGLADFFGMGFDWLFGLMLLNPNRRDACSTRNMRERTTGKNRDRNVAPTRHRLAAGRARG
jgi:hypothetical protein